MKDNGMRTVATKDLVAGMEIVHKAQANYGKKYETRKFVSFEVWGACYRFHFEDGTTQVAGKATKWLSK